MDHPPSLRPSPSLSTIRFAIPIPHLQWRAPRPPTPKKSSPRLNRDTPLLLPPVPPLSSFAPDCPTPATPSFLFPREPPPPPPTKARASQSQSLRKALSKRTHTQRKHRRRSSSISETSSARTITIPRPEKLGWETVYSPMRLHFVEQDVDTDSELVSLKSFMRHEGDGRSARGSMMSGRLDENQTSRGRGRGWSIREKVRGVASN
ncbi:hypothetical protein BCR34DRAFT_594020 [Clohesyomyces aquaticus]|uniref:Uncharacterized protein n=1 Tax=Clohesyomyces aquaticus TaxID=1231657 RepID=A0A1Y1YEA4_9PLEO|nr:hypothetical protein BCR34DRAFT_594020 [Clohesyomyces aquaticus]